MLVFYWLLVAVMVVGIVGTVVPLIPGPSLVVLAIAAWGLVNGFGGLWVPLTVAIVVLVLCIGIDFLAGYVGAKQAGASTWGQVGAIIGLLAGVFGLLPALPIGGPLVGLFLGPLLGAILGEYFHQKDLKIAVKAGVGLLVGSLVGSLIQLMLTLGTVAIFLWTTLPTLSALGK